MLKALKSYWAFTNDIYKLVMLLVVPVVLVATNMYLEARGHGDGLVTLFGLYFVDTASDIFFMNGFYKKSNSSLEFLQSSSKFPSLVKEVATVDIVRRVFVYQIPFVVEVIKATDSMEKLRWCKENAFWPWLAILIAQLTVFVARHFVAWNQTYLCTVIGYVMLMFFFVMITVVGDGSPVITNVVLMALILLISVVTVWYTGKKASRSNCMSICRDGIAVDCSINLFGIGVYYGTDITIQKETTDDNSISSWNYMHADCEYICGYYTMVGIPKSNK